MALPLMALVFFTLTGCAVAVLIFKRTKRLLSFQFLVVVNYIAINLLSGVVHILDLGSRRGYYDVTRALEPEQLGQLVLIQGVGLVGLSMGLLVTPPPVAASQVTAVRRLSHFEKMLLPVAVVTVLPIALLAVLRIRDYASTLEVFGGRIISVDGGMARYVFMSHWLVWAVSFAVIWFAFGSVRRSPQAVLAVTGVGLAAIVTSLSWSGGRSIVLVFSLPLLLVMLPLLRTSRYFGAAFASIGAVALFFYVARLSSQRSAGSRRGAGNIADWLDWEWGRFSMLGFGVDYVDANGHLFGETMVSSIGSVLRFLLGPSDGARSSAEIAGTEIYSSSSARYLAPGLSFELYVNLGIVGVFFGYLLIGWACKKIDRGFAASESVVSQLLWAYTGTVVVFRVLPSEPSALLQAMLYSATPLVVVATLSYLARKERGPTLPLRDLQSPAGRVAGLPHGFR